MNKKRFLLFFLLQGLTAEDSRRKIEEILKFA